MRLMDDPDLACRIVRAAFMDVRERFDIARTVAATQELYQDVVRDCQPKPRRS
jgi:hypothetical protein